MLRVTSLLRAVTTVAAFALLASAVSLAPRPTGVIDGSVSSISDDVAIEIEQVAKKKKKKKKCRLAPKVRLNNSTTRFGASISTSRLRHAEAIRQQRRKYGARVRAIRIFDPSLPPPQAWENRKDALGFRMTITSFKIPPHEVLSGRHDKAMLHFFRTAPKRGQVFWSYIHEPETPEAQRAVGPYTLAQYRAAWRHLVRLAKKVCRPNLYPTLILTGWTASPASGRHWKDYYPGKRFISVLAWDPYNGANHTPTRYAPPKEIFRPVIKISKQAGKPFAIAETGSALVPGDDGRGRAAWLRKSARFLSKRGAVFVTYFDSTNQGAFQLRDRHSIRVWSRWVKKR